MVARATAGSIGFIVDLEVKPSKGFHVNMCHGRAKRLEIVSSGPYGSWEGAVGEDSVADSFVV